jgi:agmatinase
MEDNRMSYPEWNDLKDAILAGRDVPMIEDDMPTFLGQPLAESPSDLEGADVVIIGSSYVSGQGNTWFGMDKKEWTYSSKRVRQQSARYPTGYIQDFDLDVFEHLKVVDYGEADLDPETFHNKTYETVTKAQQAVESKVNDALDAGALPIVIGQNSPCSSYAIAKPIAERTEGNVGVISLDTHWDIDSIDFDTMDPRVAGAVNWKNKLYEVHSNLKHKNLVEIGERGMPWEPKEIIRSFLKKGAQFYSMWKVRQIGIEALCDELSHAYVGTDAVYVHFDMDILGGAGPAPGDILGQLAEPIGMTDYEVIRLAYEIGKRGLDGFSFICIPPSSEVIYRVIVYVIMYMLAGIVAAKES